MFASKIETLLNLLFIKSFKCSCCTVKDVFSDRAREEGRFLLYNSELILMEPLVVQFFEVDVVVKKFAVLRIVESFNQFHYRRLSAT